MKKTGTEKYSERNYVNIFVITITFERHFVIVMFGPGARFSKVPRLFGRISGDIILFVSSKRRCTEARNFADILIFISYTTYEKISFTEWAGRSFTNGFSGPKSLRDFRETGPSSLLVLPSKLR